MQQSEARQESLLDHFENLTLGRARGGETKRREHAEMDDTEDDAQFSTALKSKFPADYYQKQSSLYFDTLASNESVFDVPNYWAGVVRWEWPPWLLLTGKDRDSMVGLDVLLKAYPTIVPRAEREFRIFDVQPFGRSRVTFYFGPEGKDVVRIYEEFTFNDLGEMTFIEAWSDEDGKLPMTSKEEDPWGEGPDVKRLSTRIPGLGAPRTNINIQALKKAAASDYQLAVFLKSYDHPFFEWTCHLAESLFDKKEGGTGETLLHAMLRARGKR